MPATRRLSHLCLLALSAAIMVGLSGCGGGSNVKHTTPPPDNPPPPTDDGSDEPQPAIDDHLVLVHAGEAHDAGFTGRGVVIGIVDTGINRDHPALKGRVDKSLIYLDPDENDLDTDDVVGHGTMVSEIAAGRAFGQWPGGIAPDAHLVSARIIQDEEPDDDGSGKGNKIEGSDAAFFGQYLNPDLVKAGVQVMNNSWGGLYFNPDHPDRVAVDFVDAYKPFVEDHGGLVVFAAGNEGFDDPSDLASLPQWSKELEKGWLVAVALDTQDPTRLADYSNRCGRARDYCLTAPGNVVVTGDDDTAGDPSYWVVKGTSFAAPAVSGAAAVVWGAFPYFDNDLVRQTLLGTATDLGKSGVDKVFGWGLLDVGKAVRGPAQFAWGDVKVDFDDITSTWSNDISGNGGLVKNGTGTLVLAGDNSYAGGTTVDGGTLRAANVLPGNATVGAHGRLSGMSRGLPGVDGNLSNAGTVVVREGDAHVSGDFTQHAQGTLAINLGSRLAVDGKAQLDGGTLEITGADEGYVADQHTDVLTADDGVQGTFDELHKADGVVFTATAIHYDADSVWLDTRGLDVTTAAAGHGVSYTAASMGSAQRVQGAFESINDALAASNSGAIGTDFLVSAGRFQQSPSLQAAQASLESLSGQLHAASAAMTLQAIDATGQAFSRRIDHVMAGATEHGMWVNDLKQGGGMARAGYANVDYRLDGWLVGSDVALGAHALAGFAMSQSDGSERLAGRFDRNDSRDTAAMAYLGWVGNRWYAHGRVGLGHYRQRINRMLLLGTQYQGVWTDYTGHYNVAHGESGLHFRVGGLQLTPFASVEFDRVTRGSFAEQGAGGFGLRADAQTLQRWQGGVGLKLARKWQLAGGGSLALDARIERRHTLSANGEVFDASFTGMDAWQPLTGVGLSRRSTVVGLGLTAQPGTHTHVRFGYDYLDGDRGRAGNASARFSMDW